MFCSQSLGQLISCLNAATIMDQSFMVLRRSAAVRLRTICLFGEYRRPDLPETILSSNRLINFHPVEFTNRKGTCLSNHVGKDTFIPNSTFGGVH